jgi:hypothetical protein
VIRDSAAAAWRAISFRAALTPPLARFWGVAGDHGAAHVTRLALVEAAHAVDGLPINAATAPILTRRLSEVECGEFISC